MFISMFSSPQIRLKAFHNPRHFAKTFLVETGMAVLESLPSGAHRARVLTVSKGVSLDKPLNL